jgi:hypothetical protein
VRIEPRAVSVRDLVAEYTDTGEGGVSGYGGKLDIRPAYQREFVYKDAERAKVIETVRRGYPLNVMYWAQRDDGTFEVMDGQQRTISLCQYVAGDFSFDLGDGPRFFHNLTQDEKDRVLNYQLQVYVCEGADSEKLDWFRTINITGVKLTDQELRNAVYHGPWLSDAKRWFSRTGCAASGVGEGYVKGAPIRQELLEKALQWMCLRDGLSTVGEYMATHQHDPNATDLWSHYQAVLQWAKSTFPVKRKELASVDWGRLHHLHGQSFPDGSALETRVAELMADEDVQRKPGIYAYVLDGDQRHLNLRTFSPNQKREAYERQGGLCANGEKCRTAGNLDGTKQFDLAEMEADHITPWSRGGRTTPENCQMLCVACNRQKSDI